MSNKELMKLVAKEMIEKAEDKEIKCLESYLMGFSSGLEKMIHHIMFNVLSKAKEQNIEIPNELNEIYESLQNSQT